MNVAEPFVRWAIRAPERPALVVERSSMSYGQLLATVTRFAAALGEAGVGPADRVAMLIAPPGGNVALSLAIASLGAVSVALQASLPDGLAAGLIEDCAATWLVHDRAQDVPLAGPGLKGQLRFDILVASTPAASVLQVADVAPTDPWRVHMSSGTTGRPKGILCSHGAAALMAQLQRVAFPTTPDDRLLIAMASSMPFGSNYWLRALHAGACAMLVDAGPDKVLELCHAGGATQLVTTVETARGMAQLAAQPGSPYAQRPPALRLMNVGGAAVSGPLWALLRTHVCQSLHINYGATETGLIALADPHLRDHVPSSAGRLLPWVEAQAVDGNGNPLPTGATGALRFRTPTLCHAYVGAAVGENERFRDGWFHSNDVGSVSAEGLVYLSGRANDVINVSGVKIDPERLEAAIAEDPDVDDCAVVDVPDALEQPVLVAVVVARQGAEVDITALKRRCGELAANWVPRFVVLAQRLPRNAAGKLLRGDIRSNIRLGAKRTERGDPDAEPRA